MQNTPKNKKISIVTPSLNQAQFLEECIDSVLSQNYPDLEYIIMDGGSTDGSIEIIKKYEKHLTYWQSRPDGGQYNAITEGFRKTTGDIMAWLNSDDKYHHGAFFRVAYLFDCYPGVEWLTGLQTFWGKNGQLSHIKPVLPMYCRKDFLEGKYDRPFIQQEGTFWKRSLWSRAGGMLRADLDFAGDLELWLRFFRHARIYSANTLLGGFREHGNQKSCLYRGRYIAEAEMVIEQEMALYSELYVSMTSDAPSPLAFGLRGFKEFLSHYPPVRCSPEYLFANEMCFQKMQEQLTDQLDALHSSFFWRITIPLRWLKTMIRSSKSFKAWKRRNQWDSYK